MIQKTEAEIQRELAVLLDELGILWSATANGGKRSKRTAYALKMSGVKAGIPDILIFSPPPQGGRGYALELKRGGVGRSKGRVSEHQKVWLQRLRNEGWRAEVAYGLEHALELLKEAGYPL
jgi:hypothetical protein